MEESIKYIRVQPTEIAFLKFLLEGYDGLASLTTVDPKIGIVSLCFPASLLIEVNEVLSGLAGEIAFAEIPPPGT